jgi:hypothetical protein
VRRFSEHLNICHMNQSGKGTGGRPEEVIGKNTCKIPAKDIFSELWADELANWGVEI